jgi:TolB protein
MTRLHHARSLASASLFAAAAFAAAHAQDTTSGRGIMIVGNYDPLRDKVGIVVLPIAGAFGDSVRTIIQRDFDFSDRFTVIPVDSADPSALRGQGGAVGSGVNYPLFTRLAAAAAVQITPTATGLHVALHDVARARVVNVGDFGLPGAGLSRDWRMAVHRTSDEIERWVTGQRGIAATRIAYMRGQSIRIIDSDGAEEITVPTEENGGSPAWNPSGTMLVYTTYGVSASNVGSHVVLIDLSTGRSRTLVPPGRNTLYLTPIFSPDGNSVIYSREGENGSDLFAVGIGGGEAPRQLTAGRGTVNTNPTMSPDARRVAFVSGRLGRPELYIMDADGTNVNVLTDYDFSEKNYRSDPDWSPDGRLVAYQERINDRFQIRTIPVKGGTPKQLTSDGENEQPSWAPDARHLVLTSTRSGARQLWVLDTESSRFRQLTKSAGSRLSSWSPRLTQP